MTDAHTTAADTHTAAQDHRIALVEWRTEEINAEESKSTPDTDLLRRLYNARLSHITEALDLGVPASTLAAITGSQTF